MNRLAASIALFALALTLPAFAHEGHDHAEPVAAPMPAAGANARAASATDSFELVAVVVGEHLMLYLDRFETNEPVAGARVEALIDGRTLVAEELEPGIYRVEGDEFAGHGPHALTIDVQAGAEVDLLSIAVEGPVAPTAEASSSTSLRGRVQSFAQALAPFGLWGASGAALLAGVGVVALRRRARSAGDERASTK
jgi:hypothetical protein